MMLEQNEGLDAFKQDVIRQYNQGVEDGNVSGEKLPGGPPEEAPAPPTTPPPVEEKVAEPKAKEQEPLLAGKYKTPEDLAQGYQHLLTQATTMSQENAAYREQLEAIQNRRPVAEGQDSAYVQGGSPGSEPRVNPVGRTPDWRDSGAVKKFSETTGAEPEVVAGLLSDVYNSVVAEAQRAAQEAVAPIYAQNKADAYINQKHPEAPKFTKEVEAYLETADPVVKTTFSKMVEAKEFAGAMDYAWLSYKDATGRSVENQLKAESEEAAAETEDAKRHAGVKPSSPGTPSKQGAEDADEPDPKELEALLKRAQSGDIHDQKAYRDATVGKMLAKDPAFQAMMKRHNQEVGARKR